MASVYWENLERNVRLMLLIAVAIVSIGCGYGTDERRGPLGSISGREPGKPVSNAAAPGNATPGSGATGAPTADAATAPGTGGNMNTPVPGTHK